MEIKIKVAVSAPFDSREPTAIVRKVILNDDGKVISKSYLSSDGTWIEMKEKERYPDESELEAQIRGIAV